MSLPSDTRSRDSANPVPEELASDEVEHLSEPFFSQPLQSGLDADRLDYHGLGGPGLERLCFELLVADGRSPRFFGKSGQTDRGVDLIVSDGSRCTVYQCKNWSEFEESDVRRALKVFCEKWLQDRPDLPRPDRYVLCCPLDLEDLGENESWEELVQEIAPGEDLAVELWHREILDTRLRKNPDIVADLFSERIAERFCDLDDWNQGLFRPVKPGSGERRSIERYLELRDAGRIVRDEFLSRRFQGILTRYGWALVLGPSGSGKTITTLDLACELDGRAWRVFFVDLRSQTQEDNLVEGIRRRSARPTIFVLDDAHLDFDRLDPILHRLAPDLKDRPIRLAVTAQWLESEEDGAAGLVVDLVEESEESGRVLHLAPSLNQYRRIVTRAFVDHRESLSDERVERLYESTAHDLVILDMVLEGIDTLDELDELDEESLFRLVLRRYFRGESVHAPELKRLAAVAQFDLEIPVTELPKGWDTRHPQAIQRLTVQGGRPRSVGFIHSSAAELVFRALSWSAAEESWIEPARVALVEFLVRGIEARDEWERDLEHFLISRLRLSDDTDLKQAVLGDSSLAEGLAEVRSSLPLRALSLAAFLSGGGQAPYPSWLGDSLTNRMRAPNLLKKEETSLLGLWMRILNLADGGVLEAVEQAIGASDFVHAFSAKGDFKALIQVLKNCTVGFSCELLDHLNEEQFDLLISRTIAGGYSLGTLSLALRELGSRKDSDEGLGSQLGSLESKLGSVRMVRLLEELGTVPDLLNVMQRSSADFAGALLSSLSDDQLDLLVSRTISKGRSIGTLAFTLQELGGREDSSGRVGDQLELLESKLGVGRMVHLLEELGTVPDLLRVLQYSSAGFSNEVLTSLSEGVLDVLTSRTIADARSLGTLHFALRELDDREDSAKRVGGQLEVLEAKLGTERLLRLLEEQGTLPDLLRVLEYSSAGFCNEVLTSLSDKALDALVLRTIGEGRSLGTLHFALRELGGREDPAGRVGSQLELLEAKLGADRMVRLLEELGTVFDLFGVLQYSSAGFSNGLLTSLGDELLELLVSRGISKGGSLASLSFGLSTLSHRPAASTKETDQRQALEALLGPEGLWKLVCSNGDLNHLAYLLEAMSEQCQVEMLSAREAPSEEGWKKLIRLGDFWALCRFANDCEQYVPVETWNRFRNAALSEAPSTLRASDWYGRGSGIRILNEIEDGALQTGLQDATDAFLDGISVQELPPLDNLNEAVSALVCLWRERPCLRRELGQRFWDILPSPEGWPRDHRFFVGGRLLMVIARAEEIGHGDVKKLFRVFSPLPRTVEVEKTDPLALFLFVWDLFALWLERGADEAPRFEGLQPQEGWRRYVGQVEKHAARERLSNDDKGNILRLAGVLAMLVPGVQEASQSAVRGRIVGVRYLREEAMEGTFIPAFFALQGLSLLCPPHANFTRDNCERLLELAAEYEERGPAVEWLCDWVRNFSGIPAP